MVKPYIPNAAAAISMSVTSHWSTVDGNCSAIDRDDAPGTRTRAEVGCLHTGGEGAYSEAKEAGAHGIGYGIDFTEWRVQMDPWNEIGHDGCHSIPIDATESRAVLMMGMCDSVLVLSLASLDQNGPAWQPAARSSHPYVLQLEWTDPTGTSAVSVAQIKDYL